MKMYTPVAACSRRNNASRSPRETAAIFLQGNRSADDDAWYDCEVQLDKLHDSTAEELQNVLRIHLHGPEASKSVIISKSSEAKMRLKPPFRKLISGLCLQMQVGEVVVASRAPDKGPPYYEARLQEIHRQHHSSRASCKCKFGLVWLDKEMKEVGCTAPASQIRKIDQRSVQGFPELFTWLQCTEKKEDDKPPLSDIESDWETMLEKEIEQVTKKIIDASVIDLYTQNLAGNMTSQCCSISSNYGPRKKPSGALGSKKRIRASSRTVTREMAQPTLGTSKLHLSPLAARAALAARIRRLSSGFFKPSHGKSLVDDSLEKPEAETNVDLAYKSNPPTESVMIGDSREPASKSKAAFKKCEGLGSCMNLSPGGTRRELVTHNLHQNPITTVLNSATQSDVDCISIIKSNSFNIAETSSANKSTLEQTISNATPFAAKTQLQRTFTLAVDKAKQLTDKVEMPSQGLKPHTGSEPAASDKSSVSKATKLAVPLKTKPFPVTRRRETTFPGTEQPLVEKPSTVKRSRRLINPQSNPSEDGALVQQGPYFVTGDTSPENVSKRTLRNPAEAVKRERCQTMYQIVRSGTCEAHFVPNEKYCQPAEQTNRGNAAAIKSEEDSADRKPEIPTKKRKGTKLPSGIKRGSKDAVIHKKVQASNLAKKGKVGLTKQRSRGETIENYVNMLSRPATTVESVAGLELDLRKQNSLHVSTENQHTPESHLKTNMQGIMGRPNVEREVHLLGKLHSDAQKPDSITIQQGLPLTEVQAFGCLANDKQENSCKQTRKGNHASEHPGPGMGTKRRRSELASFTVWRRRRVTRSACRP